MCVTHAPELRAHGVQKITQVLHVYRLALVKVVLVCFPDLRVDILVEAQHWAIFAQFGPQIQSRTKGPGDSNHLATQAWIPFLGLK